MYFLMSSSNFVAIRNSLFKSERLRNNQPGNKVLDIKWESQPFTGSEVQSSKVKDLPKIGIYKVYGLIRKGLVCYQLRLEETNEKNDRQQYCGRPHFLKIDYRCFH